MLALEFRAGRRLHPRSDLEALIREDYERCRPDDSFDDLKRRAPGSARKTKDCCATGLPLRNAALGRSPTDRWRHRGRGSNAARLAEELVDAHEGSPRLGWRRRRVRERGESRSWG